jgi:hypothetical protein
LVIVGAIVGFVAAILLLEFGLSAKAPHAAVLGPWLLQGDGSEIRYRAKWPGLD